MARCTSYPSTIPPRPFRDGTGRYSPCQALLPSESENTGNRSIGCWTNTRPGLLLSRSSREYGPRTIFARTSRRSEEHTSELQSRFDLVCRLLLEKKK